MTFAARMLLLSLLLTTIRAAWGGGSGLNVIVVVNQRSTNSVQLGNDYCEKRGVPPQNVLRMTNWLGGANVWSRGEFETHLRNPLFAMLASRGLNNQAEYVLLSMDIPYRVTDGGHQNSTTSALFYGFKANAPPPYPGLPDSCSLPDYSSNSYAFTELAFRDGRPDTAPTNSFLAMMLTDTTLAGAQAILQRGAWSDSTFPTQTVYLAKTTDTARSVRYVQFDNAVFDTRVRGSNTLVRVESNSTAYTNTMGLLTGLMLLSIPPNAFAPGAMGDSLTSYAGLLFESSGQTPLLEFLHAGAAGSYGTVVEPCNYTEKFPNALDYYYQSRGFSLAEGYYLSLMNPYQGVLVGEPLSAPFARVGGADWTGVTNGAVLAGTVALSPNFYEAGPGLPQNQADLFVDGTFFATLAQIAPAAGSFVWIGLPGGTISYVVPANATLPSIAFGLAAAINAQTNVARVLAYPYGDRLELQWLDPGVAGANVPLSASSDEGGSAQLTIFLNAARPTFVDSVAKGALGMLVENAPAVGDWLMLEFVKTNGTHVSIGVTNTVAGTTIGALVQNLVSRINSNAGLQGVDGVLASDFYAYSGAPAAELTLYARSAGWPAARVQVTLTASANLSTTPAGTKFLEDNLTDLRPRNHVYLSSGLSILPASYALDTTQLADGYHELAAVAYQGTSVRTQTRISRTVRIQNGSLAATIAPLVAVTNVTLDTPFNFSVIANTPNVSRLELFSTAGSVAVVSNQSSAVLVAPVPLLGVGLHPFFAVVTGTDGSRYRTETIRLRIIPSFNLSVAAQPPSISWPALVGQRYSLLRATNWSSPFESIGSMVATSSVVQWPVSPVSPSSFYRVQLAP